MQIAMLAVNNLPPQQLTAVMQDAVLVSELFTAASDSAPNPTQRPTSP
jgi:hypothetical protein